MRSSNLTRILIDNMPKVNGCSSCLAHRREHNATRGATTTARTTTRTTATSTTSGSITIKHHAKHLRQQHQQQQKQRLLLLTMTLAALLPMPEARHVHRVTANAAHAAHAPHAAHEAHIDYASDFSSSSGPIDSSDSSFSSFENSPADGAAASDTGSYLPTWHANPWHGLTDSYEDVDESSTSNSRRRPNSTGSRDVSDNLLSDSVYDDETVAFKAAFAAMRELRAQRLRQRRRRSSSLHYFEQSASDAPPTWHSPCQGTYDPLPEEEAQRNRHQQYRQHAKILINATKKYYDEMCHTHDAINLTDIRTWKWHRDNFKFLRTIGKNSTMCLKCWQRNFQTFIASFDKLGRMHYAYDTKDSKPAGDITHELHNLLVGARQVLCEIEQTINASYARSDHAKKMEVISRDAMNKRLHFLSTVSENGRHFELKVADLVFTKHRYCHHLSSMWGVLKNAIKTNNLVDHNSSRTSSASTSSGASSLAASLASLEVSSSELQSSSVSTSVSSSAEHKARTARRRRPSRLHSRHQLRAADRLTN